MAAPRKDRFSGCLVGQCLGDATGFPVEGYPPEQCRAYVEGVLRTGRAAEAGRGGFAFGQYTDDSQLAREMMASYVDCGRFEPADYAERIARIFRTRRIVGCGRATRQAALRLIAGVPWEKAGTPPPAAGNGTAMRAGPVGLMFFDRPGKLIQAAHDQGRITHRDPRCSAGAVAVAGAVALAVQTDAVDVNVFVEQISDWARTFSQSFADELRRLEEWVALPPEEAVGPIARAGQSGEFAGEQWEGISPFVVPSVLWSLYSFLRSPDDYWETICTAIAVGGDVDTTAAMAGAISGAHVGLDALPPDLAPRVNDRGTWGCEELVALAERCYDLVARDA